MSSRWLTIRCNRDVFEEKYSCIENKDGNRTELALQSNVFWLKAKFLDRKADSKWLCDVTSVEMRVLEDHAKPTDCSASSSSMQQLIIRKELIQAEACGQKIRVRLWPGNRSEAERDELKATQLPFWSWCTCGVDGKTPGQLHKCCSSDRVHPLLNKYRGKIDGYLHHRARRTYGEEVVERMYKVSGESAWPDAAEV